MNEEDKGICVGMIALAFSVSLLLLSAGLAIAAIIYAIRWW